MYGLHGNMRAQPGQRDALVGHLLRAAELLRDFETCYLYIIGTDASDADGIWVTEIWASEMDHRASLTHQSVQALIAAARPLIAEMPVRIETMPVGGKGLPASIIG
jgi:quinol monooxygenase YgiN